jgi:two-component system cell cycle response regulator DivK
MCLHILQGDSQGLKTISHLWRRAGNLMSASPYGHGGSATPRDFASPGRPRPDWKTESRILVVEDDPASLQLVVYLLKAFGYKNLLLAVDGKQGLDLARRLSPDLIVCDVKLPKKSGTELMRALKADPFLCRIPIIAVTGDASVGDRCQLMAAGFNGYISKPIVAETFVGQIEAFFAGQH